MIEPYAFIRAVTIGLGVTWTIFGVLRVLRVSRRWKTKLALLQLEERWWTRRILTACARATVLDPINLALLLFLIGLWSVRGLS